MTSDERGQRVNVANLSRLVEVIADLSHQGYKVRHQRCHKRIQKDKGLDKNRKYTDWVDFIKHRREACTTDFHVTSISFQKERSPNLRWCWSLRELSAWVVESLDLRRNLRIQR